MTTRTSDFYQKMSALTRDRQSFAVATVVGRRAPVSAHLGDRAIIYADGRMDGFVGGACAREIVRQQALELIRTRQSRLVSIRPDATGPSAADPEQVVVPMSCVSEGAVDVYIEPFVRARRLVVVGATPVADILARTAVTLDYDVVRVVDASEQRDIPSVNGLQVVTLDSFADELRGQDGLAAVVASQGHYDEDALRVILGANVAYVGLVASRKRWTAMRALLADTGVSGLDQVHNPAGLDLGGRTPGEVAVSILAELVQVGTTQRSSDGPAPEQTTATAPAFAVDPVCGMQVEIAGARHVADVNGTLHYFCCANCRLRFLKEPQQFAATRG
jgi:xanthine dehydrogenase accessory factor